MFPFSFWSIGAPAFVSPYSAPLWSLRAVTFSWGLCLRFVRWRFLCLFSGLPQLTGKLQGKHEFHVVCVQQWGLCCPRELRGCSPSPSPCSPRRPQDGAGVFTSAAAAGREVQADEDDRHRPSPPGQIHAGGDPADREGAPDDAQRCHHPHHQVGAPQARGAQGQGEERWEIRSSGGCGSPAGSIWAEIVLSQRAVSITSQVTWF